MDILDNLECLVGHLAEDVQMREPKARGEIFRRERSYPVKLVCGLTVEAMADEHPALLITKARLVEGSILAQDLVPIPVFAKLVLDRFGKLGRCLAARLEVLVALKIDFGDDVVAVQFQGAFKM